MNKEELIREIAGCVEQNNGMSINLNVTINKGVVISVDEIIASVIYPKGEIEEIWLEELSVEELEDIFFECQENIILE